MIDQLISELVAYGLENGLIDDVMYALSGRIDINELKKIIKEMRF